jgi:hypothetical protein
LPRGPATTSPSRIRCGLRWAIAGGAARDGHLNGVILPEAHKARHASGGPSLVPTCGETRWGGVGAARGLVRDLVRQKEGEPHAENGRLLGQPGQREHQLQHRR